MINKKFLWLVGIITFSSSNFLKSAPGPCSDTKLKSGKMLKADYEFCLNLGEFTNQLWKNVALAHAVDQQKADAVELLVKAGADVNAFPILHRAVKRHDLVLTEKLLAYGAYTTLTGKDKKDHSFFKKTPRQVIENSVTKSCFSDDEGDQEKCKAAKDFLEAFDILVNRFKNIN